MWEIYDYNIFQIHKFQEHSLIEEVEVTSPYHNVVQQIRTLRNKEWACNLKHTWREGNKCSDWLAKEAARNQCNQRSPEHPPEELKELLGADVIGVSTPRLIPVYRGLSFASPFVSKERKKTEEHSNDLRISQYLSAILHMGVTYQVFLFHYDRNRLVIEILSCPSRAQ